MMRVRLSLVLSLTLALLMGSAANAALPMAASIGIGVTPSVLELSAKPGATGTQQLTVLNTGDQPFNATVVVTELAGATAAHSAVAWLKVSPTTIQLEPKQKQTITVTINIPGGLTSGGYYAFVTITTGAPTPGTTGAGVAGQLGVPFLFTIEGRGQVKQEASIARFAPVLEPDGRLGFRALVAGTGNVYVKAQGKVEISAAAGKHYASLDFPESGRILPGAEQLLQTQGSVPVQNGTAYKAAVTLQYGKNQKPLTANVAFTMQIPTLAVADLSVCENLDTGPTLGFGVKNDGMLGALPNVTLTIKPANGGAIGTATAPESLVWPQATTPFSTTYGQRLDSGNYTLVVSAQLGNLTPVTKELPFQIGGLGGNPVPLCNTAATPGA